MIFVVLCMMMRAIQIILVFVAEDKYKKFDVAVCPPFRQIS